MGVNFSISFHMYLYISALIHIIFVSSLTSMFNLNNKIMKANDDKISIVLAPESLLQQMAENIGELKALLANKVASEEDSQWIESAKIPKLLGISRRTWQSYRDRRLIPFSQIGSNIYVKRSDLENFMNSHYIKSNY